MGLSMLATMLLASVAWAEDTSSCSNWRATPDGWQCSNLPDVGNFREILGPPPTATATASAVDSVSPSATAAATASATSSATATATASTAGAAQYQYTSTLPGTGGVVAPV